MKNLRRLGSYGPWAVAAALALEMKHPSMAQTNRPANPGKAAAAQPTMTAPADAEAAVNVQIAWLSDPALFTCGLSAKVMPNGIAVSGMVPSEAARLKAKQIAEIVSKGSVIDQIRVQSGMALSHSPALASEELAPLASTVLAENLGDKVLGLRVSSPAEGRVEVSGSVPTAADKLIASKCLKNLNGCRCVVNKIDTPTSSADAAMFGELPKLATMPAKTATGKSTLQKAAAPTTVKAPQTGGDRMAQKSALNKPTPTKPAERVVKVEERQMTPRPVVSSPSKPADPKIIFPLTEMTKNGTRPAMPLSQTQTASEINKPKVAPVITTTDRPIEAAAAPVAEVIRPAELVVTPEPVMPTPIVEAAPTPVLPTVSAPAKVETTTESTMVIKPVVVEAPRIEPKPIEPPMVAAVEMPKVEAPKVESKAIEPAKTVAIESPKVEEPPTVPIEPAKTIVVEAPKVEEPPAVPAEAPKRMELLPLSPEGLERVKRMEAESTKRVESKPAAPKAIDTPKPVAAKMADALPEMPNFADKPLELAKVVEAPPVVAPAPAMPEPAISGGRASVSDLNSSDFAAPKDLPKAVDVAKASVAAPAPSFELMKPMELPRQPVIDVKKEIAKANEAAKNVATIPSKEVARTPSRTERYTPGPVVVPEPVKPTSYATPAPTLPTPTVADRPQTAPENLISGVIRHPHEVAGAATLDPNTARKAIEDVCRGCGRDVAVNARGDRQMTISLKVNNQAEWDRQYDKIKALPEIAGYSVIYNVSVEMPKPMQVCVRPGSPTMGVIRSTGATIADAAAVQKAIEDVCSGRADDLAVRTTGQNQIAVTMKVRNQNDWDQLYARIKGLSEVGGYAVIYNVSVK